MKALGSILWHFPFLGFVVATVVWLFGSLLTLTVVAAPIGLGLMEYGKFLFNPFNSAMVSKKDLEINQNILWKTYSGIVSIVYLPFGLLLTIVLLLHLVSLCVSIIGIPVAIVVARSLNTILNPVNKICVPESVENEINRRKAQAQVDRYLK